MKETSLSRRKKPTTTKLKLVCSFNGAFRPRPPSGKPRYVGGETRIISVDRDVEFLKLRSKISDLCTVSHSFSLKYHVRDSDPSNHNADVINIRPVMLIATDDDVRRMIEVYDKLDLYGKGSRLWIYVCNNGDNLTDSNGSCCCAPSDDGRVTCVKGLNESLCGRVCGVFGKQDFGNFTSPAVAEDGYVDEVSVKKVVLKPQFSTKQQSGGVLTNDDGGKERNCSSPPPLIDFESEQQEPLEKYHAKIRILEDLYGLSEIMNGHSARSENYRSLIQLRPASHKQPLNPRDGNLRVETRDAPKQCVSGGQCKQVMGHGSGNNGGISCGTIAASQFSKQLYDSGGVSMSKGRIAEQELSNTIEPELMSNLNRENIVPRDGECNSVKTLFTPVSSGNQSIGSAIRSHRFGVNGTRNRRGCPYQVKNYQSNLNNGKVRLDGGRPLVGRYHPCLKPSMNISKQGQPMRLHHRNYWKAWSSSHAHTLEGAIEMINSIPSNQTSSLGRQISMNCGVKKEALPVGMQKFVDILDVPNHPSYSNGLECNKQLVDIEAAKSSSSHHSGAEKGGIASPLERSMHNLSLTSSKVESPPLSSITSSDVSEALLKPQSKPLDLMDEEQLSSGAQVKSSNGFAKEEMNQDPSSGLSIDEKVNIKESHKPSKMTGDKISRELGVYTHLATQELQTIKTSDLEYMKELGSGTYGTVFHGKWKGSDVAIKKVKPSCFTDGSVKEDRLVADFWKEAHMLGQLHHPNIVALYGVVTDGPPTNLATVTEYMVNGSLKQVLKKKDRTIDRRKRLIIAMDAAFGMEYLHEKHIVHFDLKSHNFLVNMRDPLRPVCKIGDLGLSKFRQRTLVSGGVRGTIPWMAPELLNYKNNMVTEKIDVYSFGIVMWELLTGEDPYANLRSEEIIAGIIKGDLRPEVPSWCDPAWRSLMERCWSSDPNSRPSFSEIAKELRTMAAAMNIK